MSSYSSDSPQGDNGAAINLERGRAADFIDRPLEEGEEFDRAAMGIIDEDVGASDPYSINMASVQFVDLVQQRIAELPGRDTWSDLVSAQRQAVFFFVAARRVREDDPEISDWYNRQQAFLSQFREDVVLEGIPDRDVAILELANRVYDEIVDEMAFLPMEEGNPFRSGRALELVEVQLLAFFVRFCRQVARDSPEHGWLLRGVHGAVMRRAASLDEDLASCILLIM